MTFQGHTEVSPIVSSTVVGAKQSLLGWNKKNAIERGSLRWALRDFKRQRRKGNFQGVRDRWRKRHKGEKSNRLQQEWGALAAAWGGGAEDPIARRGNNTES